MTPEIWAKLAKVFDRALELHEAQREAFIVNACSDDPDLERRLRSLLSADNLAAGFLETPAAARFGHPPPQARTAVLSSGQLVANRFEIIRPLGQGGMGQVFEAFDRELQDRIAIKVLNPEVSAHSESMNRFKREVQFARRVTHPNVCRTFDLEYYVPAAKDKDSPASTIVFLTMELLPGETLTEYMSRHGPVPIALALPIVEQIVAGLDAAHSAGVVHRDFKPSNVIVIQNENNVRAVVTDFGIARACLPETDAVKTAIADSVAHSGRLIGTLEYMAPEQLERGEATPASDIYSLGLVLYELVTNRRPFQSSAPFAGILERLKRKPVSPREYIPALDRQWEAAILRCLEIRPELRFKTTPEILAAIGGAGVSKPPSARLTHGTAGNGLTKLKQILRRRSLAIGFTLLALIVALSAMSVRLFTMYGAHPALGRGSTLMLTEVTNYSRDPELDSVTELFRSQLEQSAYMNLLSVHDIQETLERMTLPRTAPITPEVAREVALRKAVPLVIFGNVSRISDDYERRRTPILCRDELDIQQIRTEQKGPF
jgi:eukaryotic-like serine/threonine-protein kinase